jgi:hypothetical protein
MSDAYSVLLGDIPNRNALGYGIRSLERRINLAQTLLDFFELAGHSTWNDMEPVKNRRGQTPAAVPKDVR